MNIRELTDKQLTNLEKNYAAKGLTEGGPFSLAEVRIEKLRRLPTTIDTVALAKRIVELARQSEDGLVTYGELWHFFNPNQEWKGNATQQVLANALGRVVAYCVTRRLPIVTALVVRTGSRKLSPEAVANIYREAKELGVDTGPEPQLFVEEQCDAARKLTSFPSPEETANQPGEERSKS